MAQMKRAIQAFNHLNCMSDDRGALVHEDAIATRGSLRLSQSGWEHRVTHFLGVTKGQFQSISYKRKNLSAVGGHLKNLITQTL